MHGVALNPSLFFSQKKILTTALTTQPYGIFNLGVPEMKFPRTNQTL